MVRFLETVCAKEGVVASLPYHQKRVDATLQAHGRYDSIDLQSILRPPKRGVWRCRILYDASLRCTLSYHPYTVTIPTVITPVFDDNIDYRYKYADRSAIERLKNGFEEILIVKNGFVTDTSVANIAFYDGTRWLTPDTPLLQGTMRAQLLEKRALHVSAIRFDRIRRYKKIALLNAMIGFLELDSGIIA